MTPDEAVLNILGEQVNGYKMLIGLLQRERDALIDLNGPVVEELSKGKDTLILRLKLLEDERVRLMENFSQGTNLRKLMDLTGNASYGALRSNLISLVQSVEELNEFNRVLIERSLYHIRSTANFFAAVGLGGNKHGKGGILSMET